MLRVRFARMTALLLVAVLVGACGGSDSSTPGSGDTTGGETSSGAEPVGSSSAEEYATGTCTAINEWIAAIQARATNLSDVPEDASAGQDVMLTFLDGVIDDTDSLITTIEGLGVPDVEDGEAASTALLGALGQVRALYQDLRDSVADLDTSDPTAFGQALTELSSGLSSGSSDVGSALDEFQTGDLAATFQATPECASLAAA